ncbi:MAG: tryptophan synthase subunit alpha, partial [Deltaproteobacteria bacterium]|nr:tryptophan synthase subunit alpha [Deltaproteobacteria bacterium]
MLESYLNNRLKQKEILLMTHIVLGYPTFEDAFKIIESMVSA